MRATVRAALIRVGVSSLDRESTHTLPHFVFDAYAVLPPCVCPEVAVDLILKRITLTEHGWMGSEGGDFSVGVLVDNVFSTACGVERTPGGGNKTESVFGKDFEGFDFGILPGVYRMVFVHPYTRDKLPCADEWVGLRDKVIHVVNFRLGRVRDEKVYSNTFLCAVLHALDIALAIPWRLGYR